MNASLGGNAIATVQDDNKIIVYDRELSPKVGYVGAMMILGHELGHHFCHHLGTSADPRKELAADRFAGAAMRLSRMTLQDALSAVPILDERPVEVPSGKGGPGQGYHRGLERSGFGKAMLTDAGDA